MLTVSLGKRSHMVPRDDYQTEHRCHYVGWLYVPCEHCALFDTVARDYWYTMAQPQPAQQASRHRSDTAGYRALGSLMGNFPELAIFRRFQSVGALDLLYHQTSLELAIQKWAIAVREDERLGDRSFDFDFYRLQDSVNGSHPKAHSAQWRAWCEVSEKLDLYCENAHCHSDE